MEKKKLKQCDGVGGSNVMVLGVLVQWRSKAMALGFFLQGHSNTMA
jgi:hypothetical protein